MTPWVIGNWKLNPATLKDTQQLLQGIATQLQKVEQHHACQVMVAPSFIHLSAAAALLASDVDAFDDDLHLAHLAHLAAKGISSKSLSTKVNTIKLAGQDVTALTDATGAYTGDVSAVQLKDIGVEWVILGHSERRQYYSEDNESLLKKVIHCAYHGLGVVLCVGESEAAFLAGQTEAVLAQQLLVLQSFIKAIKQADNAARNDIQNSNEHANTIDPAAVAQGAIDLQLSRLIVAYEPVWAIGTGKVASVQQVAAIHHFIRQQLVGFDASLIQTPIIYGGSVNAKNVDEFAACAAVDGVLVGGAALDAQSFVNIVQSFCSE